MNDCICKASTHSPETCNPNCGCPRCWDTDNWETREELRRKIEGYFSDSIGAAREWLESADACGMIQAAGLADEDARSIMRKLTGVSV